MSDFAREVDGMVRGALNPGEQVIWTGHCLSRLGKQRSATRVSVFAMLVCVPFLCIGLSLLRRGLASFSIGPLLVSVFFLLLPTVALYTLYSERRHDSQMYCRKQTVYVLTNQRAFVLKHCRTEAPMRSVHWRYVDEVRVAQELPDHRGTVEFRRVDPVTGRSQVVLQFFRVGNAAGVADWARGAMARVPG